MPRLSSAIAIVKTLEANPNHNFLICCFAKHFSSSSSPSSSFSSWLSVPGNPLLKWPQSLPKIPTSPLQQSSIPPPPVESSLPQFTDSDVSTISALLKDPSLSGPALEAALTGANIQPHPLLLEALIRTNNFSPKPVLTLYQWASSRPDFLSSPSLFNALIDLLARSRYFAASWSLLLDHIRQPSPPFAVSFDTFAILLRRYARASMPQSAIRTYEFLQSTDLIPSGASDALDVLLDALCKEGHVSSAKRYFDQISSPKEGFPSLSIPTARTYNILINGCFRARKLRHAERIWADMQRAGVEPTVVTYGTVIEGYCRMRRVDRSIELLSEMRKKGIEPNVIVYNSIIDGLAEGARFKEALAMLEKMPLYKLEATIMTYNSLIRGYCKADDLASASKMLKMMIGRGHLPTARTYNYFFGFFAKSGKVEEAMNLYTKMIQSGYEPDRFTYHLILKILCENRSLSLAVQIIKEMNSRGFDMDLATCTMLIHLLCRVHRLEDACMEFEEMIRRGLVPEYITYKMLVGELRASGMVEMVRRISDLMDGVPHGRKLPNSYRGKESKGLPEERSKIMQKAQAMSDVLKTCRDPRQLKKLRGEESAVALANGLIDDIKRRVYAT